jgi:hypothetical protein
MRTFVIVFNDAPLLHDEVQSLLATEAAAANAHVATDAVAWHLVYAAPNRPARLKRWVSRSGWDRLTVERGRKLAAASITQLSACSLSPVQMHGFAGDAWQQSVALGRTLHALRVIDARARQELPPEEAPKAGAAPATEPAPAANNVKVTVRKRWTLSAT